MVSIGAAIFSGGGSKAIKDGSKELFVQALKDTLSSMITKKAISRALPWALRLTLALTKA